jgi:hypothetical protein
MTISPEPASPSVPPWTDPLPGLPPGPMLAPCCVAIAAGPEVPAAPARTGSAGPGDDDDDDDDDAPGGGGSGNIDPDDDEGYDDDDEDDDEETLQCAAFARRREIALRRSILW